MTVFLCENTADGIFTAVYDAWASRLGHRNVRLELAEAYIPALFTEYRECAADPEKAGKVAETVRRRMGQESYETIYRAALSPDETKADRIYRTLVQGLRSGISEREAAEVIRNLTDPDICRVFELARKVGREAHRYMGFVRFRELENGLLFSEIAPECQVLPLLAEHFANRFPNENFLIYDSRSRTCLAHRAGGGTALLRDMEIDREVSDRLSESEKEIQELWKGFFRSAAIDARTNPALQKQLLPLKFRKYMTEVS